MALVAIGCKLPTGLNFLGADGKTRILLNGTNTSAVIGGHGITMIDEAEAAVFFATHADMEAVKNGHIFKHGNSDKVENIDAIAREMKDEKTGFEGLDPHKPAPGLKPADGQATEAQEVGNGKRGRKAK